MLPEPRADHVAGLSGLARVSGSGGSGSIARDRAYTRYRPIAPKPLTLKIGESAGSTASDPPSSSTLSFEWSTASSSGSRGGKKRTRKRTAAEPQLPSAPPPPRPIRSPMMLQGMPPMIIPSDKSVLQPVLPISAGEIGRTLNVVDQFSGEMSGTLPLPAMGIGPYRQVKEEGPFSMVMSEIGSAGNEHLLNVGQGVGPGQRFDRKRYGYGFGALKVAETPVMPGSEWPLKASSIADARSSQPANIGCVGDEPAFMDRAAAASIPHSYFQFQKELLGFQRSSSDGLVAAAHGMSPSSIGLSGIVPAGIDPPNTFHSGIVLSNVVHSGIGPSQIGRSQTGLAGIDTSSDVTQSGRPIEGTDSPAACGNPRTSTISGVVDGESFSSGSNNNRRTELVTLALLPDTPSLQRTAQEPSRPSNNENAPFLSLGVGTDLRLWEVEEAKSSKVARTADKQDESRNLRLLDRGHEQHDVESGERNLETWDAGTDRYGPCSSADTQLRAVEDRGLARTSLDKVATNSKLWQGEDSKNIAPNVADSAYMEENYSTGEPMMLANTETRAPLWENQAYKKESAKRDPGGVWPYLDPLGCPTRLASFLYQPAEGPVVNATLWIFLTTIRSRDSAVTNLLAAAGGDEDRSNNNDNQHPSQKKPSVKSTDDFPGNLQGSQTKLNVIAGQSSGSQPPGSQWRRR